MEDVEGLIKALLFGFRQAIDQSKSGEDAVSILVTEWLDSAVKETFVSAVALYPRMSDFMQHMLTDEFIAPGRN